MDGLQHYFTTIVESTFLKCHKLAIKKNQTTCKTIFFKKMSCLNKLDEFQQKVPVTKLIYKKKAEVNPGPGSGTVKSYK